MKIIVKMLLAYFESNAMTATDFARLIDVDTTEIEKLLNGEAVDEPTARKFIYFFGADKAQHFIDWVAIGKVNPLACEVDGNNDGGEL